MTEKSSRDDERHYNIVQRLHELLHKWPAWGTLERADAVVRLRNEDLSLRKLARTAGCSEGTIRNYDLLGRTTSYWRKAHIDNKISKRRLVQLARDERKRRAARQQRRQMRTTTLTENPSSAGGLWQPVRVRRAGRAAASNNHFFYSLPANDMIF